MPALTIPYDLQLFSDIEATLESSQDVVDCYRNLYSIFKLLLEDMTRDAPLLFAGPYARMGYLAQRLSYQGEAIRQLNGFRARARHAQSTPAHQLQPWLGHDLSILCRLVSDCYQLPIPDALAQRFAPCPERLGEPRRYRVRVRVAVRRFDQHFLYCHDLEGDSREIKVALTSGRTGHDFHYITALLWPGCQLNLVDTYREQGVLYAEQVVLEPDYLLSIGTVARSLGEFNADPRWAIVRLLQPNTPSPAVLLGQLAGMILDACLDGYPDRKPDYPTLVRSFYEQNVLKIAECLRTGSDLSNFHALAKQQLDNVWYAVTTQLPKIQGFDERKILLEPSFFSELLGLQGRMDLLTTDYALLVEQKSGKSDEFHAFIRGATDPVPKEEHVAQIALYQAILHYNFRRNNSNISSLLLYSKYRNGLLLLNVTPATLTKAMAMRNRIVANLHDLAAKGFRLALEGYTPSSFNPQQKKMKLWASYIKPGLDNCLSSFNKSTSLESSYVCTLLDFMLAEHLISKLGSSAQPYAGMAALWNAAPDEKVSYGSMIEGLQLRLPLLAPGQKAHPQSLHFLRQPTSSQMQDNNFRYGDIVVVYPYSPDSLPDACASVVFRGRIELMSAHEIHVVLHAAQHSYYVFAQHADDTWAMEHDLLEALFQRACASVYSFLSAPSSRKDLLLHQRNPRCDLSRTLALHYPDTPEEQEVARMVLKSQQARDYMLLVGPPGTGKTSIGLMRILQEELAQDDSNRILLLSFTNRAVDEICEKLLEANIDFVRIGHPGHHWPALQAHLLESLSNRTTRVEDYEHALEEKRIFVGTSASLIAKSSILKILRFSLAIVDEASQILEPQIIGILSATQDDTPSIGRFVLIGDPKQLPAVVQQSRAQSEVKLAALRHIGLTNCNRSLFERLLSYQPPDSPFVHTLSRQGRMHPEVAKFPNAAFYHGLLTPCGLPHQQLAPLYPRVPQGGLPALLASQRTLFFNVNPQQPRPRARVNADEALAITRITLTILQLYTMNALTFDPQQSLGIIVPFRNQISSVRQLLQCTGFQPLSELTVDTVERYQGSQRDIIIYGCTITHGFQLRALLSAVYQEDGLRVDRKLNVALTRAKKQCIVLGAQSVLRDDSGYSALMEAYGPVYQWADYSALGASLGLQDGQGWVDTKL